jgi:hypothetical protein
MHIVWVVLVCRGRTEGEEMSSSEALADVTRRLTAVATISILIALLSFSARAESPFCLLPPDPATPWLPTTPAPNETSVPAPRPASDCQFYRPAWQTFLVATQPVGTSPAFLGYPSFEQIFQPVTAVSAPPKPGEFLTLKLSPRNIQRANDPTAAQQKLLDDTQAGIGGAPGGNLIDQHGHFIYYAIHVNPAFLQFLQQHNLTTVDGIQQLNSTLSSLTFLGSDADIANGVNTNVAEFKSAWMVVDGNNPPPTYFVVPAQIPHYVVNGSTLVPEVQNGKPVMDDVSVALIALHVVFTLPGHPELIWSTFEHVHTDTTGMVIRDNAPAAPDNPLNTPPTTIISNASFPLYKANTAAQPANKPQDLKTIVQFWDSNTQSFIQKDGTAIQTSVFRPYPGSKTDGSKANPDHGEDDEVVAVNNHATTMFTDAVAKRVITDADKRQYYRLVGAIWLDQPVSGPAPSFQVNQKFSIDGDQSTDDPGQPIAGEGRLGSTAMESFTEFDAGAPNCFSCHDTSAVKDKRVLIKAARLNVSHVLSKYIDSQPATP